MEAQSPNFESIKQISPYGMEYWSARDLAPLLGYTKWQNFEVAIQRAMTSCQQVGQIVSDHFTDASKVIIVGKPEPSIKPLLDAKNRKRKKLTSQSNQDDTITGTSPQDTLWK